VKATLALTATVGVLLATALPAQVQVYKCVDAAGKLSFQQSPCPDQAEQHAMSVEGDSEANIAAAESAAKRRLAMEQERQQRATRDALLAAHRPASPSRPDRGAAAKPAAECPATYENPGVLKPRTTGYYYDEQGRRHDTYDQKELYMRYKSLPSKTYLKNTGRWPKGCPE